MSSAILVPWLAFWIYWLIASVGVKTRQSRWGQFAGIRVAVVLLVLLFLRAGVLKWHATNNGPWLQGVGLAVFVLGLSLAVWARMYIGRNWGTPMSRGDDPELVTTGPYWIIRHPIYSGIILAMIGTALAVSSFWLVAVALLGAYFFYSAVKEERYMTELFPDEYPSSKYSAKMLIPYIYWAGVAELPPSGR